MFKKLKDKIAEEVKQSPLKTVQQLAHAVVSPSSSSVFEPSSNNDHFCIDDNDNDAQETPKNSPAKPGGFTSVDLQGQISSPSPDRLPSRRSSISSITSEASSLFPIFESSAAASYHLQSDMESTSEMEDGFGAGWEHLSKDRIITALQKSKQRYMKYKGRYSNIVLNYRELEVERNKLKAVLTETQDKALRRIAELKEQCFLEQKAKAHLEDALRNDLEEKDHTIDALNTKIRLLKARSDETSGNLIDLTENTTSDIGTTELKDRIQKLEGLLAKCKVIIAEKNARLADIYSQIVNSEDSQKQINGEEATNVHEGYSESDLEELLVKEEPDIQKELNKKVAFFQHKEKQLVQEKDKEIKNQNELEKYQRNVHELDKELTDLKRKFENEVTERCKAEYLVEQNTKKLKEEEQKLVEKCKEADTFKSKIRILEEELKQLNCKLDSDVKAQESLEEFMTEEVREKNKEIEEYQNEVTKLKSDLNQIKEKLDTESTMRNALEIAVNEKEEIIIRKKEIVNDLNKVNDTLKIEKEQIEKELFELKNKFHDQASSHSLLQGELENMQKKVSDNSNQLDEVNTVIEEYQIKNKKLENEVLELKGKIDEEVLAHSLTQKSYDDICKKIQEKEDALTLEFKKIEEIKNENLNLKKELLLLTEKYNSESAEFSSTHNMVKVLKEKISETESKILEQNSQIENYEEQIKSLENELIENKIKLDNETSTRLKLEAAVLDNENSKLEHEKFEKNEMIDMKKEFEKCLLEKQSVEKKFSETENRVIELNSEVEKYQSSLEELNLELIKARNEIVEKKDTNTLLENDLFAANEQVDILKTKYENSQRELLAAFEGNEKSQEVFVENTELKDKLSEMQQQFDTYKAQFQKKYQSDMHNIKTNFDKIIEDKSNEISQIKNTNEQLEEQLALKNNAVNELSANLNQAEKDSELIIKDLQDKLLSKENEIVSNTNSFKEKIKHLSENLNEILLEKSKLESELIKMTNTSEQYLSANVQNKELQLEINNLQKENENCHIKIEELNLKLKEKDVIQDKINVEKEEYEKTVNELIQLKNLHEKIVHKQQNILEKYLVQKNNVYELKETLRLLAHYFKEMNVELKEELNRTKLNCINACNMVSSIRDKQTNDFINEIEKKYSTKIKKLENELSNCKSDHKLLLEESESLRTFNTELNSKISDLSQEVSDLTLRSHSESETQDEINKLKSDNLNLKKEISELSDSHTQQLKTLVTDFQAQLAEKDDEYRNLENSQFDRRQQEECYAINEMKEQINNLQQDLETRGDAFEKLLEEHKQLVQNRDVEISELKSKQIKELRDHDKKWRACLDKRLAEEEIRHKEEIKELSNEWHAERKNLSQDMSVSATSVKQTEVLETENHLATTAVESGATSLDMVRRQLTAVTHQLNEQQRQHRHEVAELQRLLTINNHKKTFMENSSLEDCTEMEYLRNVLYEYMMGKEPLVLAKVLAAIVKFDSNQVKSVLLKEEQKITLMGQFGFGWSHNTSS